MMKHSRIALTCGLIFAISFIYAYDLVFVSIRLPDRENQYEMRSVPGWWNVIGDPIRQGMICLALPAWLLVKSRYVPYYAELVYFPLLAGAMFFMYGCLIGWASITNRLRFVGPIIMAIWVLFLYLGWVRHLW